MENDVSKNMQNGNGARLSSPVPPKPTSGSQVETRGSGARNSSPTPPKK